MELPILIDGTRRGTLTLTRAGRFWSAEARLDDLGRVARLSVYGREGSVYLGIPEPDGHGGMQLTRTLRSLPEAASYCAERDREEKAPENVTPRQPATTPRHVVWMGGRPYYF